MAGTVSGYGTGPIHCEGFGLDYADVMAVKGMYRDALSVPCVPGYEVVGRMESAGANVPIGLIGKRVVAMTRFGGYAELAVTDRGAVAVIPITLPLERLLSWPHRAVLPGTWP